MYLSQHVNTRETPQTQAISGTVANSAGGYSFEVDKWKQLDRFLILGTEGGSYYAHEAELTVENAKAVAACISENPARAVARIVEISQAGRAPKNDPALFALAIAAGSDNSAARVYALRELSKVARTGTHLFHFLEYVQKFRGWGRSLRSAVASWYTDRSELSLAQQVFKYQSRDGWSHKDALALAHARPQSPAQAALFQYAVKGELPVAQDTSAALAWANAAVRLLHTQNTPEAIQLISDYQLPRELVPTALLNSPEVWEALLPHMGLTALVRNLGKMTSVGLLAPLSEGSRLVSARLQDQESLVASRIHPLQILVGSRTYGQGRGVLGSLSWSPVNMIVDALDKAFYASFGNTTKTNKRFILGVDVSGSMGMGMIAGMPGVTPRVGAAVMAMVTARNEPAYEILGFHHGLTKLGITASTSLNNAIRAMEINNGGGTDCALPITWALQHKVPVDVFAVYTDSETWAGGIHPVQALKKYRAATGIPAKLVVVGMLSNRFSIADPSDAGMLDVVGFDTAAPELIAQFALGNV